MLPGYTDLLPPYGVTVCPYVFTFDGTDAEIPIWLGEGGTRTVDFIRSMRI